MNTSARTVFRSLPFALITFGGVIANPHNVARAGSLSRNIPASVTVSFADLDLTKPQGTAILYRRIRNAAQAVCGPVDIALQEERAYWTRCVDESIANAVAKVGNTSLTAYYLAKANRSRSSSRRGTQPPGMLGKAVPIGLLAQAGE
jgi:UrcA family protein